MHFISSSYLAFHALSCQSNAVVVYVLVAIDYPVAVDTLCFVFVFQICTIDAHNYPIFLFDSCTVDDTVQNLVFAFLLSTAMVYFLICELLVHQFLLLL